MCSFSMPAIDPPQLDDFFLEYGRVFHRAGNTRASGTEKGRRR
jgi:hypothetical protein